MAAGSLLPPPISVLPSSTRFSGSRRRTLLVLFVLVTVFLLYHSSSVLPEDVSSTITSAAKLPKWRPDLAGRIKPPFVSGSTGGSLLPKWKPSQPHDASYYNRQEANPERLRVAEPPPDALPRNHFQWDAPPSSLGNPWPARPEIVTDYLSAERERKDPPIPVWPSALDLEDAQDVLHISPIHPVPYEDIYRGTNKIPGMGKPSKKPKSVQAVKDQEMPEERAERHRRRDWVERAIFHGWEGYKASAWGSDEIKPISRGASNPFNGWGATLVDSLDLLLMLGWERDFALARTHVRDLDFTNISGARSAYGAGDGVSIPTFETAIRYLGGFLSAYDLSGDELMLIRGRELGDWILGAFGTSSGLPLGRYKLGFNPKGKPAGRQCLAEAGSLLLEMTRLSQITGENRYFEAVQRVTDFFDNAFDDVKHPKGLFPLFVGDVGINNLYGTYSLGGQADSYYEYLIKEHHLLAGGTNQYAKMYTEAIETASTYLMSYVTVVTNKEPFLTFGDNTWENYTPMLDHLTCFAGAMLALGSKLLSRPGDLQAADEFTESCVWSYNMTPSGIGPESLTFWTPHDSGQYSRYEESEGDFLVPRYNPVAGVRTANHAYKGRPETIESVFYMWRITRDKKWQDKGWSMFHALVEASAVEGGFAQIKDVFTEPLLLKDNCESFLLAETMKYYWLLFSDDDVISLDEYVLTTEAHPLKLPNTPPQPLRPFQSDATLIDDMYENPINRGVPEEHKKLRLGTSVQQQSRVAAAAEARKNEDEKEAQRVKMLGDVGNKPAVGFPVGMGGPRAPPPKPAGAQ